MSRKKPTSFPVRRSKFMARLERLRSLSDGCSIHAATLGSSRRAEAPGTTPRPARCAILGTVKREGGAKRPKNRTAKSRNQDIALM